jgi:AAA-like domain
MNHPILIKVNGLIAPDRLSYVQEIVFLRSCEGKRYREMAIESGYDYDYIKEVGFQLWKTLSQILGRKVTKKNVRLLLAELPEPILLDLPMATLSRHPTTIEFPSSPLSVDSGLYVQRSALELLAYREILKPGGLLRIKAPRQTGKTSLVLRIAAYAESQGLLPVLLDLQSADRRVFENLNSFLRWLCIHVSRQVNLEPQLDKYWDEESGSKISCNLYFQMFLLEQVKQPIVLIFDEITPLFEYPELAKDILPLFRIWHELAAQQTSWQNLRLIIVHNIEIYVPLKVNQSPFNVGVPIELDAFNLQQTTRLAQCYQLNFLGESELNQLNDLVGGNPYYLQLAFYWLRNDLPIEKLLKEAATESGIYRQDLHRQWDRLQQSPSLLYSLREIINNSDLTTLEIITAYRLESLGLIKRNGNQAEISCPLYQLYFEDRL